MTLEARFETMLKELGIKQKDFAASLGITDNYISQLMNGWKKTISDSLALFIQEKYGYSAKWVMTGEGEKLINKKNTFSKQQALHLIDQLSDSETKAVLAFVKSLDEVKHMLSEKDYLKPIAAHNEDESEENKQLLKEDFDEL